MTLSLRRLRGAVVAAVLVTTAAVAAVANEPLAPFVVNAQGQSAPGQRLQVLVDGNKMVGQRASVSLLELSTNGVFPSGPSTGELVYVIEGEAELSGAQGKRDVLRTGDGAYIPAGVRHSFRREGSATAKLLIIETPANGQVPPNSDADWVIARGGSAPSYSFAGGNASSTMLIDAPPGSPGFLGILRSVAPFAIAPHIHGAEAEIIYVVSGTGSLGAEGQQTPFGPGSAVVISPGIQHGVTINPGAPFVAVQFYTPSGPEQRFKPAP